MAAVTLTSKVAVHEQRLDEHLAHLIRHDGEMTLVESRVSRLEITQAKAIGLLIGVSAGGSALGSLLAKVLGG